MKKIVSLFVLSALLFAGLQLTAQTQVYLNLSGAIPTGDFADGDENDWGLLTEDNEGGAGFGFNAGLKIKIATGVNGLWGMVTLDGIFNGLNSDLRDAFEDAVDEGESNYKDFSLTTPKYLNLPVMGGVNYTYNFNPKFGVFAEAGLGADLHVITKMETYTETSSRKTTRTIEYDPKVSLAYQLGAGIELSKRITIGINYYNLGTEKIKGKATSKVKYTNGGTDSDSHKFSLKRITPTMVMLRVGFKL